MEDGLQTYGGFPKTPQNLIPRNLKSSKGIEATTGADNAEILKDHYQEVLNKHAEVNLSVLEEIIQYPTQEQLGKTPIKTEIRSALRKILNDKAPGDSGVTTNMIKINPQKPYYSTLNS
jgi:hypothetical protein